MGVPMNEEVVSEPLVDQLHSPQAHDCRQAVLDTYTRPYITMSQVLALGYWAMPECP